MIKTSSVIPLNRVSHINSYTISEVYRCFWIRKKVKENSLKILWIFSLFPLKIRSSWVTHLVGKGSLDWGHPGQLSRESLHSYEICKGNKWRNWLVSSSCTAPSRKWAVFFASYIPVKLMSEIHMFSCISFLFPFLFLKVPFPVFSSSLLQQAWKRHFICWVL